MSKSAIILFSAGKDSSMALEWAIANSFKCVAFISTNGKVAYLSDGPEAPINLVKTIATKIFGVPTKLILTRDKFFLEDLLSSIRDYLSKNKIDLIITGDLDHPQGIVHFLKESLSSEYPNTKFISVGEIYFKELHFNKEKYLNEVLKRFNLILSGIRLPDFDNYKNLCGKSLNSQLIKLLSEIDIDPLGEDGEYQSLCIGKIGSKNHLNIEYEGYHTYSGLSNSKYHYETLNIIKYKFTKENISEKEVKINLTESYKNLKDI